MYFKIKFLISFFLIVGLLHSSEYEKDIDMKIEQNWDRLFQYWKKKKSNKAHIDLYCKGATDTELNKLKEVYKEIPVSLIKSLKKCNSSKNIKGEYNYWIDKSGWGQLYNIGDIINTTTQARKHNYLIKEGAYEYIYGNIKNPQYVLPKEWIPIYDWNTDYTVAIDMLSENKGQIIVFCVEDGILAKWADSYKEWFNQVVDEVLQYGELRVETIEKVLRISEE